MQRAFCTVVFVILTLAQVPRAAGIEPGRVAPGFALQDVSGVTHRLSDYGGSVVLLAFVGYG